MPSAGSGTSSRSRLPSPSSCTSPPAAFTPRCTRRKEWIDRFKGQFDQGWDKVREETLARQIKLGVVPADTRLTSRPAEIPAWDSLSPDARRLYARHQEVFAGFLAYTDHEVGRLLEAIAALPDADNTLIIYVAGDNGPSAEGSLTGTVNNMMTQNGFPDTVEAQLKVIDETRRPAAREPLPGGLGMGRRVALPVDEARAFALWRHAQRHGRVVAGTHRRQGRSAHAVPSRRSTWRRRSTPPPACRCRRSSMASKQVPLAGVAMNYCFAAPDAKGRRTVQYFETGGHRAIYKDGWVATAFHGVPWALAGSAGNFDKDQWELYHVDRDFSQAIDLAASNPAKLKETAGGVRPRSQAVRRLSAR